MKKLISILLAGLISLSTFAADVSQYEPDGPMQTLSGYTDLSGGAYGSTHGAVYVDNKSGYADFEARSCRVGGDLEAIEYYLVDKAYAVNEAKNGVSVVNVNTCAVERRFLVDMPNGNTGSDGIEGITVKDGIVYVLDEITASIYSFVDTGTTSAVTPAFEFSVPGCQNAGDIAMNGDNIVIVCESRPNVVEYTLSGDFVASNDSVSFTNTEVVYFTESQMCVGGEPNQLQCYTAGDVTPPPPPPPVELETCEVTGTFTDVDPDSPVIFGDLTVSCETFSGTISVDEVVQ